RPPAPGIALTVRRFRRLAATILFTKPSRKPSHLLAGETRAGPWSSEAAFRSSAARSANISGSFRIPGPDTRTERTIGRIEPARRSDLVYDIAGSFPNSPLPLH